MACWPPYSFEVCPMCGGTGTYCVPAVGYMGNETPKEKRANEKRKANVDALKSEIRRVNQNLAARGLWIP